MTESVLTKLLRTRGRKDPNFLSWFSIQNFYADVRLAEAFIISAQVDKGAKSDLFS